VSPIDKLSLPLTIVLAAAFLGEAAGWRLAIGGLDDRWSDLDDRRLTAISADHDARESRNRPESGANRAADEMPIGLHLPACRHTTRAKP
jgi:hypothetical protein